ncbi:hypothetical protein AMAG_14158 [Allomyces macrogynus ATCC 38327]|uniref:Hsp70-like protein n=1 Tax=Allomyces macrogynus (strain ATCC 38327) TaxID=578462 RepID=A0A0L0T457_ALLM3|nr:hypothetical protein AMAG_14158 [Allomyces macrogynus ATCC 38327]|eukprot:KNE69603.1 hypothetical protein AMAG_14158 [Allomyces macrogynus ATCC 38327]
MGQQQSRVPPPCDLLAPIHPLKWKIAIDFGTSCSGFAIALDEFASALNHDPNTTDLTSVPRLHLTHYIKYNSSWPGARIPYPKTRTALLYDAEGKVVAWGNEAWERFLGMTTSLQKGHIFTDRFKLLLDAKLDHRDAAMDRLKALGKGPVEVIADYLRALVAFLGTYIKHTDPKAELNPFHVCWCLTIPAMWSDAAKQKMCRALFKAGLILPLTSDRIIFCSEPMAGLLSAAISTDARIKIQSIDPILIVDMGGGTVDLTAMRMDGDGFNELVPGLGASCGSTMLDDRFLAMFRRVVGPKVYDQVVAQHPKTKLQILRDWEVTKTSFVGESSFYGSVPIPRAMEKLLADKGASPSLVEDGEIQITTKILQDIYAPIVDQIVDLVTKMLDRCKAKGISVSHVLCIGGFSQSKYLLSALRERLPVNPLKVVASAHGPAAVLLGAPIFACRPELIRSQVARLTYGVRIHAVYQPSLHGPRHQVAGRLFMGADGITRTNSAFDVVIRKGEALSAGQVIEKTYSPIDCTQTLVLFEVFVSHLEDPVFTDTVGCQLVGKVEIRVTPSTHYSSMDPLLMTVRVEHTGCSWSRISARTPRLT